MLLMVLVAGYLVTTQPSFLFLTSPSAHAICYPPLCPLATFSFCLQPSFCMESGFSFPSPLSGPPLPVYLFLRFFFFFFFFHICLLLTPPFPSSLAPSPSIPRGFRPAPRCFLSPVCRLSRQPPRPPVLLFPCGWLGRHAPRLYRRLSERRRPTARD